MRRKAERGQKNGAAERSVISELTRCCMWEFASVSEYVYYSLLLEAEYLELSEIFERAALGCIEHFRVLGGVILALGADPALNMQIRQSRERWGLRGESSVEHIEQMISSAAERERRSVAVLSRLSGHCGECETVRAVGCVISEKKELLAILERMLMS